MTGFVLLLGALGGLITAIGTVFKKNYTVPAGCKGINFRLGEPVRERILVSPRTWTKSPVYQMGEPKIYLPGKIVWGIPGRHKLQFQQVQMRSSGDYSITVKLDDGLVYMTRIAMKHDITDAGLVMALCQAPQTYADLVGNFVHAVIGDVLLAKSYGGDRQKLRLLLEEAAAASTDLAAMGVIPTGMAVAEFTPSPESLHVMAAREGINFRLLPPAEG
jgi:hypothetical protein